MRTTERRVTKRSRRVPEKEPDKLREDVNETAFRVVQAATGAAARTRR